MITPSGRKETKGEIEKKSAMSLDSGRTSLDIIIDPVVRE